MLHGDFGVKDYSLENYSPLLNLHHGLLLSHTKKAPYPNDMLLPYLFGLCAFCDFCVVFLH